MLIRLLTILALVTWTAAQESVYFASAERVSVRRMSEVPPIELAPGVRVRTVVGTTGSFSIGDFDPGSAAVLHHHTREQADIAVDGELDMTLGDRVEKLGPGLGVIVPPDVAHSIANHGRERATIIEFHTVRRPDLVPPRPAITFPASETPASRSAERLVQPLPPDGWLRGETCLLGWRMMSGATSVVIFAGAVERFEYLVRGELLMTTASRSDRVRAGSLIVVPPRASIAIRTAGSGQAAIAEFVPAASEK
jgi:mannose-6-phosphate isomerase-like protein (cupin superfamily)